MNANLRAPTAFSGMLVFIFGTILWMVSERPEFRSEQGVSPTGQTLAVLGQGSTGLGAAWLGYRGINAVREQNRRERGTPKPGPAERSDGNTNDEQ